MDRGKQIVKVSIYGIFVNLILVVFKATVGFLANSISIILDALNNLTDVMSSVVTIVGLKLSQKRPDKEHPFGHGRAEYFSAVVVAAIVLLAGVMALKESIDKIVTPVEADYSVISLVIIMVAVVTKFLFGQYVRRKGKELNSKSLVASGIDAISDAALSFSVFVGAIISFTWHISLEGYIGVIIAIMIIRTAISILKDGIDDIIGTRADAGLVKKIKATINEYKEVHGVYDLAIHNYGPNKIIASAHIELDDDLKTREIHRLSRKIEVQIFEKYGIIMTIGVYASNNDKKYQKIKSYISEILDGYKYFEQMHGFYVDEEYKYISFDVIFDFEEEKPEKIVAEIRKKLKAKYPEYDFGIIIDTDIS